MDRTPLLEVLGQYLGPFAKGGAIDKQNLLSILAVGVLPPAIGRQSYLADWRAAGQRLQLRVAGEVPHKDDFVETGHNVLLEKGNFVVVGSGVGHSAQACFLPDTHVRVTSVR
jgi:hypothetical protein